MTFHRFDALQFSYSENLPELWLTLFKNHRAFSATEHRGIVVQIYGDLLLLEQFSLYFIDRCVARPSRFSLLPKTLDRTQILLLEND